MAQRRNLQFRIGRFNVFQQRAFFLQRIVAAGFNALCTLHHLTAFFTLVGTTVKGLFRALRFETDLAVFRTV